MAKYIQTKPKNKQDKKMKTTYKTANDNIYNIYQEKSSGKYYIVDKNGKASYFQNPNAINTIKTNKPMTIWRDGPLGYNSNPNNSNNETSGEGGSSVSTGGGGIGGVNFNGDRYDADIAGLREQLETLAHPKVWTPDELAEIYGVKDQYNMAYLLKQYNDATNKYYADAIATQEDANTAAEKNNSAYASSLLRNYINSYANAAPTAVGKGTLAANALNTQLGADKSNEEASANLNSIINSYKKAWDSELAQNDLKARQDYNKLGLWLTDHGTSLNAASVQNYVNDLKALETYYAAARNAQNNLASTAASADQQNANAALASSAAAREDAMRQIYRWKYGDANNNWQKAYNQTNKDESTKHINNVSAY